MRWTESPCRPSDRLSLLDAEELLRLALDKAPRKLTLAERLGRVLMEQARHQEAIEAYQQRARAEPNEFRSWGELAICLASAGDAVTALGVCDRGEQYHHTSVLCFARAFALETLGNTSAATDSYRRAYAENADNASALDGLLRGLSREADGHALLDLCNSLPSSLAAQKRAYTAIAYCRLGQFPDAQMLVDPYRHVMTFDFQPPMGHGQLGEFNHSLLAWLTTNTAKVKSPKPDCAIDYSLRYMDSPLLRPLRDFFRRAFDTYVGDLSKLGLDEVMPPPETAFMADAVVFLRNMGHNGQHVHPRGYVSGVYYVNLPPEADSTAGRHGSLALGCCEDITLGFQPAWPTRYVKPRSGLLVLFPSHMFHDVIPTECQEPRISIAVDLRSDDSR